MKRILVLSAAVAMLISITTFAVLNKTWKPVEKVRVEYHDLPYTAKTLYTRNSEGDMVPLDFTGTVEKVMGSVVQITAKVPAGMANGGQQIPDEFRDFFRNSPFGDPFNDRNDSQSEPNEERFSVGTGSGVIIKQDGYIVTNNHVVENATVLEVRLDNQKVYDAEIIGTDPTTDLALIKIKENNLPFVKMVNSDKVKVGEWVLAIGSPLGLNQTVTAGIVSALGRNINILRDQQYGVEAFIQTDAAINRGNSGGPLVNLNGDLIGINSAISSTNGYNNGYGFAIPSNLVDKVIKDLMNFGEVQRGVIGVMITDLSRDLEKAKELNVYEGAYVNSFTEGSSAKEAGVKEGDIITEVDGMKVSKTSELIEKLALRRPGDMVDLTILRNGKTVHIPTKLKAKSGNSGSRAYASSSDLLDDLGISLRSATDKELESIGKDHGVVVDQVLNGVISRDTDIQDDFIITEISNQKVSSVKDVERILSRAARNADGVMITGYYPGDKKPTYHAFGLN